MCSSDLGPLAEIMLSKDKAGVDAAAPEFLRQDEETPELSVASAEEAIAGAKDIIAERLSQDIEMRAALKDWYRKTGTLVTKGIGDDAAKEKSTYQMYWDYSEPLATLKSHRVLAVNRAEREGALDLTIAVDLEGAAALLKSKAFIHNEYHEQAIEDGLQRLQPRGAPDPGVLHQHDGPGVIVGEEALVAVVGRPGRVLDREHLLHGLVEPHA